MRAISLLDNFANPLHQLLPDHNASSLMTNPDSLYWWGTWEVHKHTFSHSLTDPHTHTQFSYLLILGAPILTKWVKYSPFSSRDKAVSTALLEKKRWVKEKSNSHLCINTSQPKKQALTRVWVGKKTPLWVDLFIDWKIHGFLKPQELLNQDRIENIPLHF